jgi:Zn-dependent protease
MSAPQPPAAPGLRIATIGGVPVHLGWSWFLLAAVITFVFGRQLSESTSAGYLIGVGYALVLLVAVLVHEGAHALAARSFGITVHRVVADFLGGHTAFESAGLSAGRSAVIAAAGPGANLALALGAWLAHLVVADGVAGLVLSGIIWINGLLAVFNLLPALPLDGGQLLEAGVWGATGRRSSGMVVAGWGGRILTVGLAYWVLVRPVLAGQSPSMFSVAWGLLLGSVIWRGASRSIAVGRVRGLMEGRSVRSVATPVILVPPHTPVSEIAWGSAAVLVLDPSLGLLWAGHPAPEVPAATPVSAVSSPVPATAVVTAGPEADLWSIVPALQSTGTVVLVDSGQVWGAVTTSGLNEALVRPRA